MTKTPRRSHLTFTQSGVRRPAQGGDLLAFGRVGRLQHVGEADAQIGDPRHGAGHLPLVKPWPLRPAVPDGFTLDDFNVDVDAGTVTCPNGQTRQITEKRNVTFGAACTGCPLRARCTTAARGRKIVLHEHHELQREHRQRAQDPAWQDDYRQHRPMVERSIAWLVAGGNRKVRYRGTEKNNAWLHTRTAALNLRKLLNLGLTRKQGSWVLA